jgi:hypothetical protein
VPTSANECANTFDHQKPTASESLLTKLIARTDITGEQGGITWEFERKTGNNGHLNDLPLYSQLLTFLLGEDITLSENDSNLKNLFTHVNTEFKKVTVVYYYSAHMRLYTQTNKIHDFLP